MSHDPETMPYAYMPSDEENREFHEWLEANSDE